MVVFSKYRTLDTSCRSYVHPWIDSCTIASFQLLQPCIKESLRIYIVAYSVALLMRGKIPSKDDLKKTLLGIVQSCIFLTSHGIGYSSTLCLLRWMFGNFNFLTVSFLPSFLSSIISILIERPSRRGLLSLYVTNVASETVFRMAVSRKLVKPLPYGEVLVFSLCVAYLLYFYKGIGLSKDPIYSLLRFLIGPYDERGYCKTAEVLIRPEKKLLKSSENPLVKICRKVETYWSELMYKLKGMSSDECCPHSFSCLHYVCHGAAKVFSVGYGIQLLLKIILNMRKIQRSPGFLGKLAIRRETISLGICFATFTALFRGVLCSLRRFYGTDSKNFALPAGFIAGSAFYFYRDNTIALYFLWKSLQMSYNLGVEKGYLKEIPMASVFFHAFSTAILFHVAIVEPHNLRPSYWRFLHAMSGGRIADMDRHCIDHFGLETSKSLSAVLAREGIKK